MKILVVFGTRPEAIKMAPVIQRLKADGRCETRVCVTGQHREMLDQVLHFFGIVPDYDLNLMKEGQTLSSLSAAVLLGLEPLLQAYRPDYLLVHGDTTTSAMAALAGLYAQVKICHVEAGLRTYNLESPFPEEANRQLTGRLAWLHFAPTESARKNLLQENVPAERIFVTGNTVTDALAYAVAEVDKSEPVQIIPLKKKLQPDRAIALVTCHRRENIGPGFLAICAALKAIVQQHPLQLVYPVHLNPKVRDIAYRELDGVEGIHLVAPLDYPSFIWMMKNAAFMITDSGGVQEEASALGKPIILMRDRTERPEVVSSGHVWMVGAHHDQIVAAVKELMQGGHPFSENQGSLDLGESPSDQILSIIHAYHV